MKRNRPNKPQDSPVLKQLGVLIEARLPDNHGFALLTFPLGAAVDPRVRYVGKGNREDVLALMEQWATHQRGHGWGHDPAGQATQWTAHTPTVAGLYIVKDIDFQEPDLVAILEKDGRLVAHTSTVNGYWVPLAEVDQYREGHIWLGPLPEPWKTPEQQAALPRDPDAGDVDATAKAMAEHHAQYFESMLEPYYREVQGMTNAPDEPLPDMIKDIVARALGHGYAQGIAQQMNNPHRPKA